MTTITIDDKQKAIMKRLVFAEKDVAFRRWRKYNDRTEQAIANGCSEEFGLRLRAFARNHEDIYEALSHLMNKLESTDSLEKQLATTRAEAERSRSVNSNEDKQRALNMLTYALSYTRAGADVGSIKITDDGDTARVYTAEGVIDVNIALDSAIAAIIDVCKALM